MATFYMLKPLRQYSKESPPATVGGSLSIARTSNRKWACRVGVENSSEDGLCGL